MPVSVSLELVLCWVAWFYPFLFRAPHWQKRDNITRSGPTYLGLLLESASIFIAFELRSRPASPDTLRVILALLCGAASAVLSWTSVRHLGKQFRIRAGLYVDHELVRTGPYSVVRHPIYTSVLAILLCTLFLVTPWKWFPLCLALFAIGTEIRVHTEDGLLASRFGDEFRIYQRSVRAYVPFVR